MYSFKHQAGQAVVLLIPILSLGTLPVSAIPTVSPGFFATHNAAEDFFETGHRQLERELKLLQQRQRQRAQKILQIDEQTKLNQKDLEHWDELHPQRQRKMN